MHIYIPKVGNTPTDTDACCWYYIDGCTKPSISEVLVHRPVRRPPSFMDENSIHLHSNCSLESQKAPLRIPDYLAIAINMLWIKILFFLCLFSLIWRNFHSTYIYLQLLTVLINFAWFMIPVVGLTCSSSNIRILSPLLIFTLCCCTLYVIQH